LTLALALGPISGWRCRRRLRQCGTPEAVRRGQKSGTSLEEGERSAATRLAQRVQAVLIVHDSESNQLAAEGLAHAEWASQRGGRGVRLYLDRARSSVQVLIAEDDEDHALLTRLALRAAQPELTGLLEIVTAADGRRALAYLRAEGMYVGRVWPDLVLLDIKMPEVSGLEVLSAMRADPRMQAIPVIVVTTSGRLADVAEACRLGANAYVTKPVQVEEIRRKLQTTPTYWSRVVRRQSDPLRLDSSGG
jgi:CheY-like chemotaxis protein